MANIFFRAQPYASLSTPLGHETGTGVGASEEEFIFLKVPKMAEQFCLKWNNHQSTLISNFDSLLETQKHVDCSLSAEGKILRAHKVVLSACSPYLEQLLNHERDKYPVLVFSDVKYDYLKAMLDYMYRGEVNVLQEHLNGFLKAAETLQIKGLTDQGGGAETKRKPPRSESPTVLERPSSPVVPAKRRRQRRPSQDLSDGLADTTSNSCDIPNVAPPPVVTKQPKVETDRVSNPVVAPSPLPPTPSASIQPKLEPVEPSPVIQPKTEYIDEVNDEHIEDLTLDDDDDDSYMVAKPGSSHGNESGFDSSWQFGGETSNPDMFMGTQDPTGNQNNSQGKPFVCTKCGRNYKFKFNLSKHVRYECGVEPRFQCEICLKKFTQKSSYKNHIFFVHIQENKKC